LLLSNLFIFWIEIKIVLILNKIIPPSKFY
jgi:hypothetical protein